MVISVISVAGEPVVAKALGLSPEVADQIVKTFNLIGRFYNKLIATVQGIVNEVNNPLGAWRTYGRDRHAHTTKNNQINEFVRDLLDTEELPSEKIMREARDAQDNEEKRIRQEIKAYEQRLKDIRNEATKAAEKADVKAVREMLQPKMSDEDVARIAHEVAMKMKKAQQTA